MENTYTLLGLLIFCPIAAYFFQLALPTILSDLAPGGIRRVIWLLDIVIVFLSYSVPLLIRFVFLKRPLKRFSTALLCFPLTLISADLFTSVLLYFSYILPGRNFQYVPVFYLMGWGPLFLVLYAHCSILRHPGTPESRRYLGSEKRSEPRKSLPFFRRLLFCTIILSLSLAFSMTLCVASNREEISYTADVAPSAIDPPVLAVLEEPWQSLELFDAGTLEIPESWYVEDSNGKDHRVQHAKVVQHVREALTVRPYGQKIEGLDFALEILVYWWARENGQMLPPPEDALNKTQEHQFELLKQDYPDIVSRSKTRSEYPKRTVSALTMETRALPGHVVRFKNVAFQHGEKLYFLTVGYPAEEEYTWDVTLDRILWRWRIDP